MIYVKPADCIDPALTISAAHCNDADDQINLKLIEMGITQAEIDALELPITALTAIGRALACANAALNAARGEDSAMVHKQKAYSDKAKMLLAQLTRRSLGLDVPTTGSGGLGSISIGRG